MVAGLIAGLAAGLFTGAAIYVSVVEHPARLACGLEVAVTEFGPSYARAAVMQASLAAAGALAGLWAWALDGRPGWLAGAVLLGGVIPFTLVAIRPTNARLLDAALVKDSPEAAALLARWGTLHLVRSVLSLGAFVVFLVLLARA